jgi:hypothetical protein
MALVSRMSSALMTRVKGPGVKRVREASKNQNGLDEGVEDSQHQGCYRAQKSLRR